MSTDNLPENEPERDRRKIIIILIALLLLICCIVTAIFYLRSRSAAESQPAVQYILDTSSRMNLLAETGGRTRLEVARFVMAEVVRPSDPSSSAGLRLFGAGAEPNPCADTSLLVPLGPANQGAIADELQALDSGVAPDSALAQAMIAAIRDLAASDVDGPRSLVIVTGGEDDCQIEAAQLIAQEAARAGIELRTFVIGFQVTPEAALALKALADSAGGGYYLEAHDEESLQDVLEAVQDFIEDDSPENQAILEDLLVDPEPLPTETPTPTFTLTPTVTTAAAAANSPTPSLTPPPTTTGTPLEEGTETPTPTPTYTPTPTNTPIGMVCRLYANPNVPVSIAPGMPANSNLNVPHSGTVVFVSVEPITVNYTGMQNLNIELIAPNNATVTLFRSRCTADSMQLGFSGAVTAETPLLCPDPETEPDLMYRPAQALSLLNGQNQQGTWQLRVNDIGSRAPGAGTPAPTLTPTRLIIAA
jgi:subtilisin-like proprotein convertase family protein